MAERQITIRDAVHGDILVTPDEISVMDTFEVQRLRRIKQLGTTDLIYPTALHTRFDHSLGTLHMAQRMIDVLQAKGAGMSRDDVRHVRLAALVHDVTHVPFGHTFEDERKLFERHDRGFRTDYFLRSSDSELADALRRIGAGEPVYGLLSPDAASGSPAFLSQIVSSTLDADMFDYIRRDLMFTGLRQDYDERIFAYFERHNGSLVLNMEKNGVIRGDALSETMNLLRLRYTLSERVYYHHTKSATAAMLSKAVECAQGLREADLLRLGDDALLSRLENEWASDASRRLIAKLRRRQLYKRAYQISYESAAGRGGVEPLIERYHESREARAETERELAKAIAADPDLAQVIIYCPASKMYFKEAAVKAILPGRGVLALSVTDARNPAKDELAVLQRRYRNLWSFYVFLDGELIDKRSALTAACEGLFGRPNVYQP